MPELPEVERAKRTITQFALARVIEKVETTEDSIVFSGISNTEFGDEITGRRVTNVERYGKVFYIELDGNGRFPVLHFGMTGNVLVKGQLPFFYKEGTRKGYDQWPPRFMKFILHLSPLDGELGTEIAFVDARRLGRVRLCSDPINEPPISALGFDPILSMPTLKDFSALVLKRSCPVKALLLDQSFSAGVGNWVADEVLYHSRVHPEQRCNTLNEDQLSSIHRNITYVCQTAIDVNADASKFPENWLFWHRWGKGKRNESKSTLQLPTGGPATLKWLTVGGRTSAFVVELQVLGNRKVERTTKGKEKASEEESELTPLSEDELKESVVKTKKRSRKAASSTAKVTSGPSSRLEQDKSPTRTSKRRKVSSRS